MPKKVWREGMGGSGFVGYLYPGLRPATGIDRPRAAYSYIVYKEDDKIYVDDWKGRNLTSADAGEDDACVIQAAYEAASGSFVDIFVKEGVYELYSDLNFDIGVKNFALVGEHRAYRYESSEIAGTVLKFHNGKGIKITYSTGRNRGFRLEGLRLDGIDKTGVGIKIGDQANNKLIGGFEISDITLTNFDTGVSVFGCSYVLGRVYVEESEVGFDITSPEGSGLATLLCCGAFYNTSYGIYIGKEGVPLDYTLINCNVAGNDVGLYLNRVRGFQALGLFTEGNNKDIVVKDVSSGSFFGGHITGNIEIGSDGSSPVNIQFMNVVNGDNKDLISFNIIAGYGILIDLGYHDTDVISRITGDLTYTTLIRNNWTHGATLFDGRGVGATRLIIPTSAPSSPKAGDMYFDTDTSTLYIYDGSAWKSVSLT